MHEIHLIKDLFSDLLAIGTKQHAARITNVYLRIGNFTELNEEVISFYIKENAIGTLMEGSNIHFEKSDKRELTLVSFDFE